VSMKIAVFWGTHRPDDGGSKHLWNVGKLLPDYTVLQPKRQQSSYYHSSRDLDIVFFVQNYLIFVTK
jgi:hypothetical protein